MLTPRPYQAQTNSAIFKYMAESGGDPENTLIAWPVGTGKAFGIALFIKEVCAKYPNIRLMVTCPTEELVDQNYAELKDLWPLSPAGIYCDGLKRYDTAHPIIFGTIQSIAPSIHKFGRIDIMLPDECHRISKDEDTQYHKTYTYLKEKNKFFFMLGWTATDYRQGQGKLTDEGGLFSSVLYDATTTQAYNWFFNQGYLIPPISSPTDVAVSGETKRMVAGDYNNKELQDSFERDRECGKIEAALREAVAVATAEDRKCWIAFVPGVAACEETVEILEMLGVSATCVHSKMKKNERRQRLKDYKAGKYTCMVNNGILTTGFNHKPIDMMIMLRKTASASLWVQMLGRGTRPWYADGFDIDTLEGRWAAIRANGKLNFRVMDFVGNIDRLGPINDPVKPKAPGEKKAGGPPIKLCGSSTCGAYNHPSVRHCFYCGWEFPIAQSIEEKASTSAIVRPPPQPPKNEWLDVKHVTYKANYRTKRPTIVATYWCQDDRKFEQYICLEHDGQVRGMAKAWWKKHQVDSGEVPTTVLEAMPLTNSLKVPTRVLVWVERKMVRDYEFG